MQLIQKKGFSQNRFKAQWLRHGHADSVGVNTLKDDLTELSRKVKNIFL